MIVLSIDRMPFLAPTLINADLLFALVLTLRFILSAPLIAGRSIPCQLQSHSRLILFKMKQKIQLIFLKLFSYLIYLYIINLKKFQ